MPSAVLSKTYAKLKAETFFMLGELRLVVGRLAVIHDQLQRMLMMNLRRWVQREERCEVLFKAIEKRAHHDTEDD